MWGFLLGVLSAVALSVCVELLTGGVTRVLSRIKLVLLRRRPVYDPADDGLIMLGEWSPNRTLDQHRLQVEYLPQPDQSWIDQDRLRPALDASSADSGDLSYLVDFRLDHRESLASEDCRVTLAPSDYRDVRAIERLRISDPRAFERVDVAVSRDPHDYLTTAVPSSLAINVVVMTPHMEVLCCQRSTAVDNAKGAWTVGIFETLKRVDSHNPGRVEDFFGLAQRGLEEELGLRFADISSLRITWCGIYAPLLRGHVVAIAQTRVPKDRVIELARRSHSSHEHKGFEWRPLTRKFVEGLVSAPRNETAGTVGAVVESWGLPWLEQSALAAVEAYRFRATL